VQTLGHLVLLRALPQVLQGLPPKDGGSRGVPELRRHPEGLPDRGEVVTDDLDRVIAELEPRAAGCFMCRWIQEDLAINGKLTGHPARSEEQIVFPVGGKLAHLKLEKIQCDFLSQST
jgi:hypothetical protein